MGLFDVGDDEGGTSFLANLHNQQRKLDNLGPGKAGDNKSITVQKPHSQVKKAGRFALAADEDNDDFFAEFDVDLDMDGDLAPPKQPLSNIPENSSDMDLNPTSDSAADGAAAEAFSAPATNQLTTGSAAPDAAPQIADGSATDMDAVTQTCDGQAKTSGTASSTENGHCEYAAAVIEGAALNTDRATGHEAVHDVADSAPTSRPAPLLTQLAENSVLTRSDSARAISTHSAGEPQLPETHAAAQPPAAAAVAQPADGHETHPAQALPRAQSGNASSVPHSAYDHPMNNHEAAGEHAPSHPADMGADTSSGHELADGSTRTQLGHGLAATELEGTAPAEPADAVPDTDKEAIPMQTDLPIGQETPSADRHDQPSQLQAMVEVDKPKTAQTQAQLQSNNNHLADAQHSSYLGTIEEMQSESDHPALDGAGSDAMLDSEMADSNAPVESATTDATRTLPVQQGIDSTSVLGSMAHELDTDMEDAISHGDEVSDHQVPEGEPVDSDLGPPKRALAADSEARDQSDFEFGHAPDKSAKSLTKQAILRPAGQESDTLERQPANARPASKQMGSVSDPAEASCTPSKAATPDTSHAGQPAAIDRQGQGAAASMSSHIATSSAVAGPVSKLYNQPPTPRPVLPASPSFQKCTPMPAAKTAFTPLAMGSDKNPFKPAAASPLTSFAGRAVSSSPQTSLTPITLHKPLLPISRSTGQARTGRAMPLSNTQQPSTQRSTSMFNVIPKLGAASIVKRSGDNGGQQSGGKFAVPASTRPMLPSQVPAKPASKVTGTFHSLFKQPLSASSGSAQLAETAALGLPPAHATLAAPSSKAPGLPKPTSKTTGVVRAAPTTGASPCVPVTHAASMPVSGRPLSGQGVHATSSQHVSGSPHFGKQAAKPAEQSLRSRGPAAPDVQTRPETLSGGPTAHGSDETDTVMEEDVQRRQADPKPWTSTSLAAGLMGSMKNLEQMLLEIQQMHDDVLEHKVNVAISSNRLTRLDNPIIHDKLKSLKRQAERIFQAADMEELGCNMHKQSDCVPMSK